MASSCDTGGSTPVHRQPARECPICLRIFRVPKMLQCGHSVCSACVDVMKASNAVIECPVCRAKMNANVAGGLPTNFALQSLIDDQQQSCDKAKKYSCLQCARRYPLDEMWTCTKCSLPLVCANCVVKDHRDHDVQAFKELLEKRQVEVTEWHRQLELNYGEFTGRQTALSNDLRSTYREGAQFFSNFQAKLVPLINKAIGAVNTAGNALAQNARNADLSALTVSGGYEAYLQETPREFHKLKEKQERIKTDIRLLHDVVHNASDVMNELVERVQQKIDDDGAASVGQRNEASGGMEATTPGAEGGAGWWDTLENELTDEPPSPTEWAIGPSPGQSQQGRAAEEGAASSALPTGGFSQQADDSEMVDDDVDNYSTRAQPARREEQLRELRRIMNNAALGHGRCPSNPAVFAQRYCRYGAGGIGRGAPVDDSPAASARGHGRGRGAGFGRGSVFGWDESPLRYSRGGRRSARNVDEDDDE